MRIFGIALIVIGIVMLVFKGFNFQTQKKVADIGPIEINRTENNRVSWPLYGGAIAILAGVVLIVVDKRKS